jgi:hypothetical protein
MLEEAEAALEEIVLEHILAALAALVAAVMEIVEVLFAQEMEPQTQAAVQVVAPLTILEIHSTAVQVL